MFPKNIIMEGKVNRNKGFTLIEILVVVGIIAVLATIVIIAINPAKQFAQARNTQRTSNVNAILNAIGQRVADNKGIFQGSFTIGATTYTCPTLATGDIYSGPGTGMNLSCLVPTYISALPTDPTWISGVDTLYNITVDQDCTGTSTPGRISVSAPLAANETAVPNPATICVTR